MSLLLETLIFAVALGPTFAIVFACVTRSKQNLPSTLKPLLLSEEFALPKCISDHPSRTVHGEISSTFVP